MGKIDGAPGGFTRPDGRRMRNLVSIPTTMRKIPRRKRHRRKRQSAARPTSEMSQSSPDDRPRRAHLVFLRPVFDSKSADPCGGMRIRPFKLLATDDFSQNGQRVSTPNAEAFLRGKNREIHIPRRDAVQRQRPQSSESGTQIDSDSGPIRECPNASSGATR